MFYSQTFLARKGALSTVWIAAHLQHRLKKSHYTATDIPSTVQHIMDPEVPIALRMSGHLLLGVVRIYSKKVDYLFHDCNVVLTGLTKAFASIELTLPEEARQAPFHSITLPETLYLDALNMEDELDGVEDVHLKSQEEITLTDRIPVVMDHYVAISFDEDIMMDSSHTEVLPDSGSRPMEEDPPQATQANTIEILRDSNNGHNIENPQVFTSLGDDDAEPNRDLHKTTNEKDHVLKMTGDLNPEGMFGPPQQHSVPSTPLNSQGGTSDAQVCGDNNSPIFVRCESQPQATQVSSIERRRDPNNDRNLENTLVFANHEDDDTEPNRGVDKNTNEKDHVEMTGDLDPEGNSAPSRQHSGPPTPPSSQGAILDAQAGGDNKSPHFELAESPPIQQPQRRGRKRKQFFDIPIVLSNEHIREALKNTRDIKRKRRDVPSSNLGTWKLNNSRRKEHIFDQPLLTGFCNDLLDISKSAYVHSKSHLVVSEEDHADARDATTLSPTNQIPEEPIDATETVASDMGTYMGIEHLRNVAFTPPRNIPAHDVVEGDYRSPNRRDGMTATSPQILGSVSIATETMKTPNFAASPGGHGSETMQTAESADTHHLINSAETDELGFLEMDNNTPASSQGTSGSFTLSETTRRVAQHLKGRLSPITPILEEHTGDLSLNEILEGKKRKIAARMFFEVLVLKAHGLIDAQQEVSYGDINLTLSPTLLNAQI